MADPSNNCEKLNSMLLKESLWRVEDKLNVLDQSVADVEAGLIRLRGTVNAFEQRLLRIEQNRAHRLSEEGSDG